MSDVNLVDLRAKIAQVMLNPMEIQIPVLELYKQIANGEYTLSDPTNPFVNLLEYSAVNTSAAVAEQFAALRSQYSILANTQEEIYNHLSNKDFIGRFATPITANFMFIFEENSLFSNMVFDGSEQCYKIIIPAETQILAGAISFRLQYPIVIRKYSSGFLKISYDTSVISPLEKLSTNNIVYEVRKDTSLNNWISFTVPMQQFDINSVNGILNKSGIFSEQIILNNKFYFIRVYYRNRNTTNNWVEIKTTHTDQVFNPNETTALIKVYDQSVKVTIPPVYLNADFISGELRVDVYESLGELTIDMSSYKNENFVVNFSPVDEAAETSIYTAPLSVITCYVNSKEFVSGGTNSITFEMLKEKTINNSMGDRLIPITNAQLEADVDRQGFELVLNTDVLTNRIFLAIKKLPLPTNSELLTPASIGISTFIADLSQLKSQSNIIDNGNSITIKSDNLFVSENGIIKFITAEEINALYALSDAEFLSTINSRQYLYNPFYYVADTVDGEFDLRAYDLDYPVASNLGFVSQNESLQMSVNIASYELTKLAGGYRLIVVTRSGNYYKQAEDGDVVIQLAFKPVGENTLAYINGFLEGKTETQERIYSFDILTDYFISKKDRIRITNATVLNSGTVDLEIDLDTQFNIYHTTNSLINNFVPDPYDHEVGKFLLPPDSSLLTKETIQLKLGEALNNLWTRSRSLIDTVEYMKHENDIPMTYHEDVYELNATNGLDFNILEGVYVRNPIIHHQGDPVLDSEGNQVYLKRKGDLVLTNGEPTPIPSIRVPKEMDLLFVDGKYYFANETPFVNYRKEIVSILNGWITTSLESIRGSLLDKTKIFYYPKTTLGTVKVFIDNLTEKHISAEQSFKVDLDVRTNVFNDELVRKSLIDKTITILDKHVSGSSVNLRDINNELEIAYGASVVSFRVYGLGGDNNYRMLNIANEHNRLCLKKRLVKQTDGFFIVQEDVEVSFYNVERSIDQL